MTRFVAYDVTRLLLRCTVPVPNGIDRIDLAYARHFVTGADSAGAGVFLHGLQPALLDRAILAELLAGMEAGWRAGQEQGRLAYANVRNRLLGVPGPDVSPPPPGTTRRLAPLRLLRPRGLRRALFERMPRDAVFIHTTHYPTEHLFRWLKRRPDMSAVFFIHDLLPLQFPEYFAPAHIAEHRRAMEIFARYGRAAIVNTHVVEQQVRGFLRQCSGRELPVLACPIPPDPVFAAPVDPDPDVASMPYFVVCATIEPRKNHLTLLHVWRELSRQSGVRTPKLVVVGRRGWENENVVDLLDRSHEIRRHVIEVAALPTAGVAKLLAGARALLMPSFAEGYGLPIIEARAIGTPVIASDIPVFREIAPDAVFCHPLDGPGWLAAVTEHAARDRRAAVPRAPASGDMADYFAQVESFIASL